MSFEELFAHLIDPSSPEHQSAWKEFMRRYEKVIKDTIAWRCYNWNSKALKKQISDVIDTVKLGVLHILCRDDFRALKNFRHKDNETRFKAYLRMIATHEASRHLIKYFPKIIIPEPGDESSDDNRFLDTLRGIDDQSRWELYEHVVDHFYDQAKKKRGNLERDIHIFWLYVWAEFDHQMIINLPCLRGMEEHNVNVVVNRMKDVIRGKMDRGFL